MTDSVVPTEAVEGTISEFTELDKSGDKGRMNKLAQRLGKEQPALLNFAARVRAEKGEGLGEAAVFYGTLVWAMFDRAFGRKLPRLLPDNITEAEKIVAADLAKIEGLDGKPPHEHVAASVAERQPHLVKKLTELLLEDVTPGGKDGKADEEPALTAEQAAAIFPPTQVIVEAFDGVMSGRRPGQVLHPIVRDEPKVGRNDPCPCGSGKKYKRCHAASAEG